MSWASSVGGGSPHERQGYRQESHDLHCRVPFVGGRLLCAATTASDLFRLRRTVACLTPDSNPGPRLSRTRRGAGRSAPPRSRHQSSSSSMKACHSAGAEGLGQRGGPGGEGADVAAVGGHDIDRPRSAPTDRPDRQRRTCREAGRGPLSGSNGPPGLGLPSFVRLMSLDPDASLGMVVASCQQDGDLRSRTPASAARRWISHRVLSFTIDPLLPARSRCTLPPSRRVTGLGRRGRRMTRVVPPGSGGVIRSCVSRTSRSGRCSRQEGHPPGTAAHRWGTVLRCAIETRPVRGSTPRGAMRSPLTTVSVPRLFARTIGPRCQRGRWVGGRGGAPPAELLTVNESWSSFFMKHAASARVGKQIVVPDAATGACAAMRRNSPFGSNRLIGAPVSGLRDDSSVPSRHHWRLRSAEPLNSPGPSNHGAELRVNDVAVTRRTPRRACSSRGTGHRRRTVVSVGIEGDGEPTRAEHRSRSSRPRARRPGRSPRPVRPSSGRSRTERSMTSWAGRPGAARKMASRGRAVAATRWWSMGGFSCWGRTPKALWSRIVGSVGWAAIRASRTGS